MKQQINLYLPQFRPKHEFFTSSTVVLIVLLSLVMVSVAHVMLTSQLDRIRQQAEAAEQRHQQTIDRLDSATQQFQPRKKSKQLQIKLVQTEKTLAGKQAVLKLLEQGGVGNTQGFSAHLESLARQNVDGAWLTALDFQKGGMGMHLSGSTIRPDLIPQLVQRLAGETVFKGLRFEQLELKRAEDEVVRVDFNLYTRGSLSTENSEVKDG